MSDNVIAFGEARTRTVLRNLRDAVNARIDNRERAQSVCAATVTNPVGSEKPANRMTRAAILIFGSVCVGLGAYSFARGGIGKAYPVLRQGAMQSILKGATT